MATAPECCGFAPHWAQNGVFEAGKGGPLGAPSPPPLFPVFWLESLLPPPQALIAAIAITIRQLCRKRLMGWTSSGCGPQLREFTYSEKAYSGPRRQWTLPSLYIGCSSLHRNLERPGIARRAIDLAPPSHFADSVGADGVAAAREL